MVSARVPGAKVARLRRGTAALVLAGVVALSGCSSTFTAQPYTPGIGTNIDQGLVRVRGLVIVVDGEQAWLTGGIVNNGQPDTLVKLTGSALDTSGAKQSPLAFPDARVSIPSDQLVKLTDQKLATPTGDLQPGLTAELTLEFEKAGAATLVVPVVDKNHRDYSTIAPSQG